MVVPDLCLLAHDAPVLAPNLNLCCCLKLKEIVIHVQGQHPAETSICIMAI